MTKVLTFSRTFPAFHPKAGEQTYFVEKIWKGLYDAEPSNYIPFDGYWQKYEETFPITNDPFENIHLHEPKYHTIRAGNNWKVGDMFSPRVWSGKPYNSPQITIAPDIRVEKVWDVEVDEDLCLWIIGGDEQDENILEKVARNDGLELQDLLAWFNKPMIGQIICWSKDISY